MDLNADACLHTLFEQQVARTPGAIAVTCEGQALTYRELNARANCLAYHLRSLGVGPDTLVGLYLDRSLDLVVGILGILKADGAYLPLDPTYPKGRLAFMLADAQVSLVVTSSVQLAASDLDTRSMQLICLDSDWPTITRYSSENLGSEVRPEHLTYVIYTSGSTGTPKGVAIPHANVVRLFSATSAWFHFNEQDVWTLFHSYAFDFSVWELWGALLFGGRLVIVPYWVSRSPNAFYQLLEAEQVTVLNQTPSAFRQLMQAEEQASRPQELALRLVIFGGEALGLPGLRPWTARHGDQRPQLVNMYGITETTVHVTYRLLTQADLDAGQGSVIGGAIPDLQLYILDAQLQPAPIGVPGELYVGGRGLARSYLRRPEVTAERFIPHPFSSEPGARLYRSGDLARYLSTGDIEYLGRIDRQVKIRGFRIELGEIEAVLVEHPAVREAVVLAREDSPGDKRLVAYITPAPNASQAQLAPAELRAHLKTHLPDHMLPVAFVQLERLPLTSNGKVDRSALPVPGVERPELEEVFLAAQTPLEQYLAHLWQELLGIAKIGVHDDFFELGGDSIKATIFINKLQERFGVLIYVVALFDAPNIADLAKYLGKHYPDVVVSLFGAESLVSTAANKTVELKDRHVGIDEEKVAQIQRLIKPLQPRVEITGPRNAPAIFVLSPPRSGSTLLRVMLGGHPKLFSPPELDLLSFNTLAERKATFSGRDRFWLEGTIRAIMQIKNCDAETAKGIMAECEERHMSTRQFYRLMQEWLGERILVDKTPAYALDIEILRRAEEDFSQALYIHLIRHPGGMINSFEKAKLDQVFFRYPHSFSTRDLAELVWVISHENIINFLKDIPAHRQYWVHFEDLVQSPQKVMAELCQVFGLEFHPDMIDPYKGERMTDGISHGSRMMGDIKFHEHQAVDAEAAEQWKEQYSEDLLGEVTWKVARALGYEKLEQRLMPIHPRAKERGNVVASTRGATTFPLSFAQQRLWFLDQLEPGNPFYNIPSALRITGKLDVIALERSLKEIIRRHESLRTTFAAPDGEAEQIISAPCLAIQLPIVDLTSLPEPERVQEARRLSISEAQQPFDLAKGPLLRTTLLRLTGGRNELRPLAVMETGGRDELRLLAAREKEGDHAEEHLLLLTMHHIIADGWSAGVFFHELNALYAAFAAGGPSPLPELPIQYADYAVWQRQWLEGEVLKRQLSYWKQQLSGAPAMLELPTDHPRPPVQTFRGAYHTFTINPMLVEQLKTLSKHEGATLFMTLLAAFQVLLARYTGQHDIVVGTPIANRNRAELEKLIGFFVNTLALRVDLLDNPTFKQMLRRVRKVALDAYAHQDFPFEKLVDELGLQRDLSRNPLFQVTFVLQNAPQEKLNLAGLHLQQVPVEMVAAKFDAELIIEESDQNLKGTLRYNKDLFEAATIARVVQHYITLLEGIAANPEQCVADLPLLTGAEQRLILEEWNQTGRHYPSAACLQSLFEEQVARTPEAVAVLSDDGTGDQLSYAQLNARANQLAHYLRAQGVGPETLVGLCLERSANMLVGLLGILKAGGAYVPLDPTYPLERLAYMLQDANVPVLLTQERLLVELPACDATVVCLDRDWARIACHSEETLTLERSPEHLAYVIYTSGSTGKPKGAMNTHRAICNRLLWMQEQYQLNDQDRVLQKTPFSFDVSVWEFFWPLITGARLVIAKPEGHKEATYLVDVITREEISTIHFVPSMLQIFLEEPGVEGCVSLQRVICSGEALSYDLQERFFERCRAALYNLYGPTEAAVDVTFWTCERGSARRIVPIGRPIANTQIYILDQQLQPVPIGVAGELYIGGVQVGRGYLNRAELTAEKFIRDTFSGEQGARLYKTGDLARYLPDGTIEYLGRIDHQVKIRGFRIELGEIEAVLAQHAAVREVVVVAREERDGDKRLVAYVVPDPRFTLIPTNLMPTSLMPTSLMPTRGITTSSDAPCGHQISLTPAELRAHLRARLPDYMLPAAFVVLEQLPLNANGKLDRRALPAPDLSRSSLLTAYVAPRTPAEELLASTWAQVLKLERVGIHDNFFELGGDSILSMQIIARARKSGLYLTPKHLFQHQTIAQLGLVAETPTSITAEQGLVVGPVSLTPIQCAFFAQRLHNPHHFNQARLFQVDRALDPVLLEEALQQVLAQHDAFCLRFEEHENNWQQISSMPTSQVLLNQVDLSQLPAHEQRAALEKTATALQSSLSVTTGPLLRVALFRLGAQQPDRLLFIIHHLVVDSVSWGTLLADLQTAYQQRMRGEKIQLPAKTTSFQQWARRLVEYAQSETIQQEAAYWLAQPQPMSLPVDLPSGINSMASTCTVTVELDETQTQALLQEVPPIYHTQINDLLLTALVQAFAHWTGRKALLVDLEGHGREDLFADIDLSRTVGWFTTLFPVWLDVEGTTGAGEAIKAIKEQLYQVPNRGISYGLLRYLCQDHAISEKLRSRPQAEVSFNYLGQVDRLLPQDAFLVPAQEPVGPLLDPNNLPSHLLEINARVLAGRLRMQWTYSTQWHHHETITRLAQVYLDALQALIVHCQLPEAGGYTPSDFPLAHLDQSVLDRVLGITCHYLSPREGADRVLRSVEEVYPLSSMQQGMLFHTLYAPQSGIYCEVISYLLRGNLQVSALRRAWQQVVERHAVLRTSFRWEGLVEPLQVVHTQVELPWQQRDWRGLPQAEQETRWENLLYAEHYRSFELAQAPLMRLTLIRVEDEAYRFIWASHHALLDGWAMALVLKEVLTCYEALCQGQEPVLAPTRPYRDYIAWLQQQDLDRAETYWRGLLGDWSAPTPLGVDRPVAEVTNTESPAREKLLWFSREKSSALQTLARSHRLTLNTLVQGSWALLLHRYSGQDEVLYGTTVSGRPAELTSVETMVGLFINTLPVRVRVTAEARLSEWLQEIQAHEVELRQYEYSELVQVQGYTAVPRGTPLFESIFVFENYPLDSSVRKGGGSLLIEDFRALEHTNYPLVVAALPGREEWLGLRISYDPRRFDDATIQRMLDHLQTLLEGMTNSLDRRVIDLPLLTEAEEHLILEEWNQTGRHYPPEACLHTLFEHQAARTPEAIAVVSDDGSSQQLTYAQLNERANQLAHYLRAQGVGPETVVGLCLERGLDVLVGLLGILKAGGAYVPLDPSYPAERLAYMLADAQVQLVVTSGAQVASLPVERGSANWRAICLDRDWSLIAQSSSHNPASGVQAENLAYLIYTSGSTGQPKGVAVSHRAIVNRLLWCQEVYPLHPSDRVLHIASISFDIALWELLGPLCAGAQVLLARPGGQQDSAYLAQVLVERSVSVAHFVPSLLRVVLEEPTMAHARGLRLLACGGEAWGPGLGQQVRRCLPQVHLVQFYGPTEAAINATAWTCPSEEVPVVAPIGRPIANMQVYLLDAHQQVVPIGVAGEIYLGGVGLARGYLHRPDLSAERFVPHPYSAEAGERLYRTGDLGRYLPSGEIEYLGRIDQQVKIRGFRIELGEIEVVLAQHGAVRETVVVAREEADGDKRLVAYVVVEQEAAAPSTSELRAHLQTRLPGYMLPAAFVLLEQLPLNANGKLDQGALPAPDQSWLDLAEAYVAPRTPTEDLLAAIWAQVLKLDQVGIHEGVKRQSSIGIYDNFFELGGHSLLATQVVARIREAFQVDLPLRSLFEAPTIAGLAERIEAANRAMQGLQTLPILRASRDGELPLSFAQQRLWFLDQWEPNSPFYNVPIARRLIGKLDVPALERSLNEIVRRHEALRTTFIAVDGHLVQRIMPTVSLKLTVVDLQDVPDQERELQRFISEEAQKTFDLSQGPLFRATLIGPGRVESKLDGEEIDADSQFQHVLLLCIHHIVSDAWSVDIIFRELSLLYTAYAAGHPISLPEPAIQYADFAIWQRKWLQGEVLGRQVEYWKQQLSGAPGVLDLPTDHPRPAVRTYNGAKYSFVLSRELTRALQELSQQEGVTLFMTLLTAFQLLLARYSRQEDIVVGTPIANRTHATLETLVGFFVNTLVLRTDLSSITSHYPLPRQGAERVPTVRQTLARVREVALEAYAHQDLPFEKLVEELQPERTLSHNPLFQVFFTLEHALQETLQLPGVQAQAVPVELAVIKADLELSLIETQQGLRAVLRYNTDLFEQATIARMATHYLTILESMVVHPEQSISSLPLLPFDEQGLVLQEWNQGHSTYFSESCLHTLFEQQVGRTPEAIAVVCEGESLTYAQLNARANSLAHYLRSQGLGADKLAGLYLERSLDLIVGILGILKAGGAYLPLDPSYPAERLAFMLTDAQVQLLITTSTQLATRGLDTSSVQAICLDSDWPAIAQYADQNPLSGVLPEHLAYVIYTSGSTGTPKGVAIPHAKVVRLFTATDGWFHFNNQDVWTLFHSYAFDFSVWELWGALLYGGRLVVVPYWVSRSPETFYQLLATEQVTVLNQTPSAFRQLIQAEEEAATQQELAARLVIFGGEALDLPSLRPWFARHGDQQPHLVNMYGITETTVHVTYRPIRQADVDAGQGSAIGGAIPDLQLYILDAYLQPVPIGVAGELFVGGRGLARGYLRRPEVTAERFVPHPFSSEPGAQLYRSGDLARYLPSGDIEYLGRTDQQVKIRGFRIELGEIEAVLTEHPAVREAIVQAREDTAGDKRLVAYVVAAPNEEAPGAGELRAYLHAKLPDYMLPAVFVPLEQLPLTSNGKVDRRALPAPEQSRPDLLEAYVAPRSPVEEVVAAIWTDVLWTELASHENGYTQSETEELNIGIHDNFFELGGHSLLATQIIARIREAFRIEFPLRRLFEAPTIAELAEAILRDSGNPTRIEKMAQLMIKLMQLSENEVETMLDGRTVTSKEEAK